MKSFKNSKFFKVLKKIGEFILYLFLFLLWWVLYLPFTLVNFIICVFKCDDHGFGYFRNSAINGDKFACQEFRTGLNAIFTTKWSYKFGLIRETMSGVFGKNQRTQRQTGLYTNPAPAMLVCGFLDTVDKEHCERSIDDNVSWEIEQWYLDFMADRNKITIPLKFPEDIG